MKVRPALIPAALAALALTVGGCAGTEAPASSTSSAPPSAPSSGSAGSGVAAGSSATGQRIEVQVADGRASGNTGRVRVATGTHVTLVITSDAADEVHLHGYDVEKELAPGEPAVIELDATIPGVFEVELHEAGTVLLSLQVG